MCRDQWSSEPFVWQPLNEDFKLVPWVVEHFASGPLALTHTHSRNLYFHPAPVPLPAPTRLWLHIINGSLHLMFQSVCHSAAPVPFCSEVHNYIQHQTDNWILSCRGVVWFEESFLPHISSNLTLLTILSGIKKLHLLVAHAHVNYNKAFDALKWFRISQWS